MDKISELKAGTGKINLEGKITKLDSPQEVLGKFGRKAKTQKTTLQDETGEIELSLWNDDCGKFNKGDKVEITNGWVSEFRGNLQLSTGKFGKIELISKAPVESFVDEDKPRSASIQDDIVRADKIKPIPTENQVREWSMKRGGFSHDAATLVAAMIRNTQGMDGDEKTIKLLIKVFVNQQIEITDELVKAAEEREAKFRKGGL